MGLHLFSTTPLENLATRMREIKEFSKEIFPEIEIALDDMGLFGSVEFTSSRKDPCGYDTAIIEAKKQGDTVPTVVTVQFPSATPIGNYIVRWKDANGVTNIETSAVRRPDLVDVIESYFAAVYARSEANGADEDYEEDNVKDAKECKAALDKYIVGSDKLKGYGLETVLTEDASTGAEMPVARVELGIRADKGAEPYYKAGDLLEYYTFDFSGGMCNITFHLQGEDWDEMLSDHPSVTSMIKDLAPDMIDELENSDFVNRPGEEN